MKYFWGTPILAPQKNFKNLKRKITHPLIPYNTQYLFQNTFQQFYYKVSKSSLNFRKATKNCDNMASFQKFCNFFPDGAPHVESTFAFDTTIKA